MQTSPVSFCKLNEVVQKDKINGLIKDNDFVMFFSFGKETYAAPEESRLSFAYMKKGDKEESKFAKKMGFHALNLKTKKVDHFTGDDIRKIKIIPQEKAVERVV